MASAKPAVLFSAMTSSTMQFAAGHDSTFAASGPSPACPRTISRSPCCSNTITAEAAGPNISLAATQMSCITVCSVLDRRAASSSF